MSRGAGDDRDRDASGRPRNARPRDRLGRPVERSEAAPPLPDEPVLPPDQALRHGQELLDAGAAFSAHEVFEAVWKASSGPDRELWRGLAQLCVGVTHALRGNAAGAVALLGRAADTLAPYADTTPYGVDVEGVRAWAIAASGDVARATEPPRLVGQAA